MRLFFGGFPSIKRLIGFPLFLSSTIEETLFSNLRIELLVTPSSSLHWTVPLDFFFVRRVL